jgi:capsular polysaccharide transport system permease protein
MFKDLATQFNVLKALTIHNLQGQMSTYSYGFAWVILEPLFFIAGFRLMRQFLGNSLAPPGGMTPLMFYVLGVIPLFLAFDGLKAYGLLVKPTKMLAFPRVTPLDMAVASGVASFAVYFILFWIIAVPVSMYEGAWPPDNIMGIILGMILGWMLGLGLGFILSGAVRVFPPARQFIGYAVFGLRMSSGLFFSITMVPVTVWPYLDWNPLLNVTEIVRDAWFESYVSPIASPRFVIECLIGILLLGLSVERFMRRVPAA